MDKPGSDKPIVDVFVSVIECPMVYESDTVTLRSVPCGPLQFDCLLPYAFHRMTCEQWMALVINHFAITNS